MGFVLNEVESGNGTAFSPSTSVFPSLLFREYTILIFHLFTTGAMELQQLTAVGNKALLSLMAQLIFVDALTLQGRKERETSTLAYHFRTPASQ